MLMWLPKNANEIKVKINVKDITTRSWIFVMLKKKINVKDITMRSWIFVMLKNEM